jgi:hypothetical protein
MLGVPELRRVHPFGRMLVLHHGDFDYSNRRRSRPISTAASGA